ncbi:unnamed protein product, partial [Natator depressus]
MDSRDPLTPCHIQSRAGPKQIRPTLAIPPERNIDGSAVSELEYLKEPANLVQGSATALFSVIDNILGTAMQYLQQLFQMPFGCREQNMVLFAPNIYVLDYLNKTGQLSEETKSKAIGYLANGYQKQLSYEHPDRSYSVFGSRDKEGRNTWLSAFGGVYDEFSLTAYITMALLNAGHPGLELHLKYIQEATNVLISLKSSVTTHQHINKDGPTPQNSDLDPNQDCADLRFALSPLESE